MYNDKILKSVAEAVKQVMEAELSAKQKAIAKIEHPKHKIDAGDLASLRKGKKPVKEAEQVDEAKEPGFKASYGLGKKGTTAKKPEAYGKRVQGKGYDNPENERKAPEGHVSMTSLMPGHDERAAKFLARQAKGKLVKGKAQSAVQKEEIQITESGELGPVKDTLGSVMMVHSKSGKEMKVTNNPEVIKRHKEMGYEIRKNVKEEASQEEFNAEIKKAQAKSQGTVKADVAKAKVDAVKQESVEQIDERSLTEPETAEKERLVKSMKKGLQGFKQRYGERAKSVMYATATKLAKGKE